MTKGFEEGLSEMCSLSFSIEEIGEKKAIEKGSINTLFKLVKKGKITIDEAAETVGLKVDELLKKKEEYEKSNY